MARESQYGASSAVTPKKDRRPDPTGAIIDSQSVKGTPEPYVESGCDGGLTRYGQNLTVKPLAKSLRTCFRASIPSKKSGATVPIPVRTYSNWVLTPFECQREVVRKKKGQRGFHWLSRWRRLSNNYERKPTSSETQVYFTSSRLLRRQICNHQTPRKMAVR